MGIVRRLSALALVLSLSLAARLFSCLAWDQDVGHQDERTL